MTTETAKCERFHRALCECHKRIPAGPTRDSACRHLNRSLAQCLVSVACPSESEVVRSLCSSGGTSLKRSQCQQAQLSLSIYFRSSQGCTLEAAFTVKQHIPLSFPRYLQAHETVAEDHATVCGSQLWDLCSLTMVCKAPYSDA
ncbi:hypothetical protein C5167_036720 [Papaver somniferum]|uniref:COX assembly mitochondrial protein n=1 Tax=Papaver somniferum TaxID=3469 RepID=A0A4Y7I8N1_PAPSO|nr:hypothetical protein C5167_036720 [Papaver somniferum]